MSETTFEDEFKRRISDIKRRAQQAGTSITALCQATGIARATPDRWAARTPKTIRLIDELEKALVKVKRDSGKQKTVSIEDTLKNISK